jgi:NADPH:quinone reductase-like Zn-dependent oxidoreductase
MKAIVITAKGGPEVLEIREVPTLEPRGDQVRIPENLDFASAAAVPQAFITAHDALITQAHVSPGERILIHAVGSGVGTAAIQLAHAMGCEVSGHPKGRRPLPHRRSPGAKSSASVEHAMHLRSETTKCHLNFNSRYAT